VAALAAGVCMLALTSCGSRESLSTLQGALRPGSVNAAATSGSGKLAGQSSKNAQSESNTTTTIESNSGTANTSNTTVPVDGSTGGTAPVTAADGTGTATGGPSTAGNPTTSGGQACSGQKSPVVIGSVGEQSGIAGASVAAGADAVAAWAASIDASGGLDCHIISFVKADDGGDPSTNLSETEQLVQQDHVAAFVYDDGPLAAQGSEQYLVDNHIPVIGSEGAEQFYYEYPNFFPQFESGAYLALAGFYGIKDFLTPSQQQHVGVLSCIEAAECSTAGQEAPADSRDAGLTLVYNGSASLTSLNFDSQCESAVQDGVQAFLIVLDPNSIERLAQSCQQVGYKGVLVTSTSLVNSTSASDSLLNGLILVAGVLPWTETNNPQVVAMDAALARYAPGVSPVGTPTLGWTAAQLFEASAAYWPDTDTITSADILAAMDQVRNNDLGGLTEPLSFFPGQDAAPLELCSWDLVIDNGQYDNLGGGQRACVNP
jgi:branched-chain amino acid transport system substrate-binding protein